MRLTASPHTKASTQNFSFQQIMGSPAQQLSSGDSIFQVDLFFGSTQMSLDIVLNSGTRKCDRQDCPQYSGQGMLRCWWSSQPLTCCLQFGCIWSIPTIP